MGIKIDWEIVEDAVKRIQRNVAGQTWHNMATAMEPFYDVHSLDEFKLWEDEEWLTQCNRLLAIMSRKAQKYDKATKV